MDNIVSVKLDSRYASTLGVWQYDYGQVLRITGPELPPAVEVQFSLDEKSGETLSRVGTTVDGVTEVKIPDELLTHSATSNYRIYAYIYLTDETSGNTKYEITIPVRARSKPTPPTEDPETDPDLFRETVVAVNASAERAENAASSAMESAASADETLAEIKRVADGISEDIENANTAKSELSDTINSAEEKKKELESSIGKAGEAKTSLDSSISSAGEKQLALDATVEQANAVDASLKEQIGSAEQIQANVEQIAKNKADISSLNEDLADLKDKKITKFYASNQGENHLADSENGKIQDMMICGNSNQNQTKGKNLLKYPYIETTKTSSGIMFTDNKDGSINVSGTATDTAYYNLYSNMDGKRLTLASGTYKLVAKGRSKCNVFINNGVTSAQNEGTFTITDGNNEVWCFIQVLKGLAVDETIYPMIQLASITDESYEPYTGGKPSPSPDYPQEIKSVVNPVVKVCGKNILDMRNSGESITNSGVTYTRNADYSFTRTGTATDKSGNIWLAGNFNVVPLPDGSNVFCTLKMGVKYSIIDCVLLTKTQAGIKSAKGINFTPTEDMYITGVRNEDFVVGKTYNDIVYPAVYVGANALQYEPYREQLLTLPYTLNAIPVSGDGNVTVDGQQYIADRVVEKDGVFGIERNTATDVPALTKELRETHDMKGRFIQDGAFKKTFTPFYAPLVNIGYSSKWGVAGSVIDKWIFGVNKVNLYISPPKDLNYTSEDIFNVLKDLNIKVYGALLVPFFEPLPGDIQAKLRTLVTNYPVTNISVTSDQLDGYTVFNYPISMANGWNYVKQQLNDNRDYIYDMDIQSAEAYVNSEYAVALTELEV